MTKRERVIAAIEGKKVDAIPSSFSLHFPKNQAVGDEAVAAHLKFFKETDTDIVKVMNEHLVPYYGMIRTPKDYYDPILQQKHQHHRRSDRNDQEDHGRS